MDLAAHQRILLGLLRSKYQVGPEDDPYIRKVAQSKELEEGRLNILLWRVFVLERTAVLTFVLLKHRQLLKETLSTFITQHNISPFRETQAPAFLESLTDHPDSLVASVARFELALLRVRRGDPASYLVRWDVDPRTVLNHLARDIPLDDNAPKGAYAMRIARQIPSHFEFVSLEPHEDAVTMSIRAAAIGPTPRSSSIRLSDRLHHC